MANNRRQITKVVHYIFVLKIIAYLFLNGLVEGRKTTMMKDAGLLVKHKGAVKTIESDDGDVIDCVDIYKQPAFDHPLLKNHTIQMKSSSSPRGIGPVNSTEEIVQSWQKYGQCPEGTVPLKRTPNKIVTKPAGPPEHAQVSLFRRNFGAYARINVWNPTAENGEYSAAKVQVVAGSEVDLNSIEAGWVVNSDLYGDNRTRIYSYWTVDNFKTTGCYNFYCPGFVQTSQKVAVGFALEPISKFDGPQYEIDLLIYKDKKTKNWWLKIQNEEVGYWPASILNRLTVNTAKKANWGGEIFNKNSGGHHTKTQMGSGHFPNEGPGKSSYFNRIGYVDPLGIVRDPEDAQTDMTAPSYYTVLQKGVNTFFFGGPGYYGG